MRISTKNKSIALFVIGLVSLAISAPSAVSAGATQADVDYTTKLSALTVEFSKVTTAWGAAIAKPPTFAIGSKWSKYKASATSTSNAVLATVAKMSALVPSAGFTTSGKLLKTTCAEYKTAITALNNGIVKNDVKLINKANPLVVKASNDYLAWTKAYTADMTALNG